MFLFGYLVQVKDAREAQRRAIRAYRVELLKRLYGKSFIILDGKDRVHVWSRTTIPQVRYRKPIRLDR